MKASSHGVLVRDKGSIRIRLDMNWRFSSRDISCSESNFRSPAVLMSAVIILGSPFCGLVFTRGSAIRTVKKGMAIVVTQIDIISLFLEILIK